MLLTLEILIYIVLLLVPIISFRIGLFIYLIGALVFPTISFGTFTLRFELIYCLWLLFLLFIRKIKSDLILKWHSVLSWYGLFLIIIIFSTMINLISESNVSGNSLLNSLISLYGLFRPFIVMFLFVNESIDVKFIQHILWIFVYLSIPISLLSIGQTLGVNIATRITLAAYVSLSRTPVFTLLKEVGVILRSTGVLESPVYNGVYFLMVETVIWFLLVKNIRYNTLEQMLLYLALILGLIAGITTLSSTFLLGLVILFIIFIIMILPKYSYGLIKTFIYSSICIGLIAILISSRFIKNLSFIGTLNYEIRRILTFSVLNTRYNSDNGFLIETIKKISEHPIIGFGTIKIKNIFVGDSLYVTTLYTSGIIGLIFFMLMLYKIIRYTWHNLRFKNDSNDIYWIALIWSLILLAVGVGSPSFFILRLQEWYWAIIGLSLNPKLYLFREAGLYNNNLQIQKNRTIN